MTLLQVLALIFMIVGSFILLRLSPGQIAEDLTSIIFKDQSLREKILLAQGKKKKSKIRMLFTEMLNALRVTGSENKFTVILTTAFFAILAGTLLSIFLQNVLILVVATTLSIAIPFGYARGLAASYNKQIADELETALSIVTTAYMSSEDIIYAIESSINNINPPVQNVFKEFLGKTKLINSNVKLAIVQMKDSIHNEVFYEWCDNLVECIESSTLKHTLQPITARLSDIRIVNAELDTKLQNPRKEFITMLIMSIANIPMLYFLNKEWFLVLVNTTLGQVVVGVCVIIWIVTTILMFKFTQPLEFKR